MERRAESFRKRWVKSVMITLAARGEKRMAEITQLIKRYLSFPRRRESFF
jgi:hypothetical protein